MNGSSKNWMRWSGACLLVLTFTATSAWAVTHGTLVANDGNDVYDYELKALIDTYIPIYGSMILAFTECYGGDKMDDFAGKPNTAVLSGSTPGNTTEYGGYHRGLAQNLKPGSTTDAAHAAADAAKKPGDTPNKAGPNQNIGINGPITSTHVLVWAGQPNAQDQADINDIKANFPASPSQSVTVLSGAGGAGTDGAATYANLKTAMKNIGAMMNPNEQFILFVTDHGDIDHGNVASVPAVSPVNVPINITPGVVGHIQSDPNNNVALSLTSDIPIATELQALQLISVNSQPIYQFGIDSFFDVFTELQINLNEDPAIEKYHYVTKPGVLSESGLGIFNMVTLDNGLGTSFFDVFVSIDSGAISRIPEPATLSILTLGCLALLHRRRAA